MLFVLDVRFAAYQYFYPEQIEGFTEGVLKRPTVYSLGSGAPGPCAAPER